MAAKSNKKASGVRKPAPAPRKTASQTPVSKKEAFPATQTFAPGFWKNHYLPALLFMAFSFALYQAAIGFGYVLDDQMIIWGNEFVQKGFGGMRDIFAYDSFMGYFKEQKFLLEGGRYRPLSLATFALEVEIFGKDKPAIGHIGNIALYGFTGILLYRILLGLFPVSAQGRWYFSAAFWGAMLFLAHPLHVECVANIKGRDELLALFFSLAALYASLKYFDTRKNLWLVASGLFLFLGLLAKENAITFLAVIPLTLWFFAKVPAGRSVAASVPLLAGFLLFFIIRFQAMGYVLNHGKSMTDLMNNPFLGMNFGEKYATIFLTLGWYLKLLFVPHPLTHDYYPYHVPKVGWGDWRALLSLAIYVGMAVWAFLALKKRKVPAYAIWFYLITLSIVSNVFVSIGTFMNERFLYMPSAAFCLLGGWFLARQLPEWFKKGADTFFVPGLATALLVVGLYSYRTVTRVPDWKDALSLNTSAVRVSENSARSHLFYVTAIYENIFTKIKDKQEKAPWVDTMDYHISRALEINPNYGSAWHMRSAVATARYEQDGDVQKLLQEFDTILDHAPKNTNFRNYLDQYMKYLAKLPIDRQLYVNFCLRNGYERFYKQNPSYPDAIQFLEYGLLVAPDDPRLLSARAEVRQAAGSGQNPNLIQGLGR